MSSTDKSARKVRNVKTGGTELKAQNKPGTGEAGELKEALNKHNTVEAGEVPGDAGETTAAGSTAAVAGPGDKIHVKQSTVEAARKNLQKAPAVLGRTFATLAKSKDAEPLREIFSDMEEWTGEKKDLLYKSTILLSLISYAAALPEYLANNNLEPSLFAFTEIKEDETGRQTSEAEKFIEYMTARTNETAGPILPGKVYYYPHDLLTMHLDTILDKGEQIANIPFNGETIPAPICATSAVIGTDTAGLDIRGKFGNEEKRESASLITLYMNGRRAFTLIQLCREIAGNPDLNPSDKEKEDAKALLAELNKTMVDNFDLTEWARAYYNNPDIEEFKINGLPLIQTSEVKAKVRGHETTLYFFREKPLILEYASLTNQIWEIDQKHRDIRELDARGKITDKRIRLSSERLAIIDYLLYRICLYRDMQEPAERNYKSYVAARRRNKLPVKKTVEDFESHYNEILFESTFEKAGLDTLTNKETRLYKDFIEDCFKYWKASGFIKDYEIMPGERKNSTRGIKFFL